MTKKEFEDSADKKKKRDYNKLDPKKREILIQMVIHDGAKSMASVARKLGIEYENAKAICRKFRLLNGTQQRRRGIGNMA